MKRHLYLVGTVLLLLLLCGTGGVRAAVVISEFMAENDGFLFDEDGESPDWIEIHNDSLAAVDLTGWHLTDSATNLTQWTFPSATLAANSYLVVFASGKDRAVSGQPLHTNFRLENSGEYLALVMPDGTTIAHSYAPEFLPQRANHSFGIGRQVNVTSLVSTSSTARILVPTDGLLSNTWTARAFADEAWTAATAAIGFDTFIPTNVLSIDVDERATAPLTFPGFHSFVINSNVSATAIQTNPTVRVFGPITVTVSNTPPVGYDDRVRPQPTNSATFTESLLLRDLIFSRSVDNGGLDVRLSGLTPEHIYQVTVWSFDTSSTGTRVSDWFANGLLVRENYTFSGGVQPASNDDYRFTIQAPTDNAGQLLLSGRRDDGSVNINGAEDFGVFLNAFHVRQIGYDSHITTDIETLMLNSNASVFIRIPFALQDPNLFQRLRLRIKYEDGFAAYLNGQLIVSRNAPSTLEWNSTATEARPPARATAFEEILLLNTPGLLMPGNNVLAIHGLNVSADDGDFLVVSELDALQIIDYPARYFGAPSPAAQNEPGYLGFVDDTKFSVDRGFYDAPFSVEITSATPGAEIRWTLNGSAPGPTNGFIYTNAITVTNTTILRAAAFASGLIPTEVDTHTYIFLDQVLRQPAAPPGYPMVWPDDSYPADYGMDPNVVNHTNYGVTIKSDMRAIPSLSIVTDFNSLWDITNGIYLNSNARGVEWERATSAELILPEGPNGSSGFAVNCGIRMQGNASRDNLRTPKHSFRLLFKNEYGPTKLDYDWFPGRVDQFDNIALLARGFVDAWATRYSDTTVIAGTSYIGTRYRPETAVFLRDVWFRSSMRDMGWTGSRSAWVHLYLNGLYWGLYNPTERLDASFMASHLGGRELDWDVLVGGDTSNVAEPADGNLDDWRQVMAIVNAGITNETAYQAVAALVDIDNLIDYMMLHIFGEAEDWPHHNWYAVHRRANSTNGFPATKWIFIVWDQEVALDRLVRRNRVDVGNSTSPNHLDSPARIYARLRAYHEFRRLFGDRIHKHLFNDGALTPSNNIARLMRHAAEIDRAIVGESARWGDAREFATPGNPATGRTFTRDEWWVPELQHFYTNFFATLNITNIARFRAGGLYPNLGAPAFSQFGGDVPAGFALTMSHTNPAGTIFYTVDGTDPRVYGSGAVGAGAQAYSTPIPINTPTLVRARVLNGITWSALVEAVFFPPQDLSKLFLTEIMYHPPVSGTTNAEEFEFLELKNTGTNALNLSGLTFVNGISFVFSNGTVLGAGEFFVLVRNPTAFTAKYPGVAFQGIYSGRLANEGETVTLAHALGQTVFSVNYGDAAPWPVTADGLGFSLVQREPILTQAPDNGTRWRASAFAGGSPGADDPEVAIAPILINEVLSASVLPEVDRIELFNPTTTNVDISGWFLTDANALPKKFRIPDDTMISPGAFMVFTEAHFNPMPAGPNNFSLSSRGEQVYLLSGDANTNLTGYSHGFSFDAADPGVTFGRYVNSVGEEQFPSQIAATFEATNAGPVIGPVVINEIHYHPAPGSDEFIELKNISGSTVPLFDSMHPSNTWRLNGVGFLFPSNLTISADGYLLLVATNPAAFRTKYSIPAEVPIIGPYAGALQDSGERLKLERPASPDTNGPAFVVVDEVRYNDRAPWSAAADGAGPSLQRKEAMEFGNDPINWDSAIPTPGQANTTTDSDGDGIPDAWEIANGTQVGIADADADPDNDGRTNFEEYIAGTHPGDASSEFTVEISLNPGPAIIFNSVIGRRYTLEYSEHLPPVWSEAQNNINGTGSPITLQATNSAGGFYRVNVRRP